MRTQHLIFLLKNGLDKKKQESFFADLRKAIEMAGGKIKKEDFWGKKQLEYQIEKQHEADYFDWEIKIESSFKPAEVNTLLNRESNLIRYLFVND